MPPLVNTPEKITYFAETDYRSKRIKFGIRDDDRERHMYIIGKTGMGKSTLLENLAIQDIQNGEGICFIDPHGGTAETLLSYIPEHRIRDVVYLAPFDIEHPVAINVMEDIGRDKRSLVASGLIGAFKKVWIDAWSPRMEYLLNNALLALLEYPGATLLGVNRIFSDKNYRAQIVNNVQDPSVKLFWTDEYAKYSDKFATEATAAIQNKVGQFSANPLIRNMIGQPKSTFDIRRVMDEKKILIVNLSKGRMGEGNANLVGSMLITKIYLAAMSRADVGPEDVKKLPPFYLYVDEFQSFANESFADILSEARKYKLSLTVAHQYIEQMSEEVRAAVFGNVGTMITFRIGPFDAEIFEKEFSPTFTAEDLVNLGFAQIYLKLMIKQIGSPPFSATTLPRPKTPPRTFVAEVIAASREQFSRSRAAVEEEIKKWHAPVPEPPRDPNAPPETRKYAPGTRPQRGASAPYGAPLPAARMSSPREGQYPPQNLYPPYPQYPQPPQYQEAVPPSSGMMPPPAGTPPAGYSGYSQTPAQGGFGAPPLRTQTPAMRAPNPGLPPRADSAGGPLPAPPAAPTVHQPFRSELSKLISKETAPSIEQTKQNERRPQEGTRLTVAPLASLKTEPKKDKGPSQANLSNLKAILGATPGKKQEEAPAVARAPAVPPLSKTPPKPPSLLEETENAKEVPEDVLKGLLED